MANGLRTDRLRYYLVVLFLFMNGWMNEERRGLRDRETVLSVLCRERIILLQSSLPKIIKIFPYYSTFIHFCRALFHDVFLSILYCDNHNHFCLICCYYLLSLSTSYCYYFFNTSSPAMSHSLSIFLFPLLHPLITSYDNNRHHQNYLHRHRQPS